MVPKASSFVAAKSAEIQHVEQLRDQADAAEIAYQTTTASTGKADALHVALELARPHTERPGSR